MESQQVTENRKRVMMFDRKNYDDETLLNLYKAILLPRMIEEKMLLLLRKGKISKWFSGIGQEAISVADFHSTDCSSSFRESSMVFLKDASVHFTSERMNTIL